VFPNPACLNLQQRFERFKRWRFLAQAVQARKYFSDGLQAGLQAAQAMLISGNCHCRPVLTIINQLHCVQWVQEFSALQMFLIEYKKAI
jgi:hypothetical protein